MTMISSPFFDDPTHREKHVFGQPRFEPLPRASEHLCSDESAAYLLCQIKPPREVGSAKEIQALLRAALAKHYARVGHSTVREKLERRHVFMSLKVPSTTVRRLNALVEREVVEKMILTLSEFLVSYDPGSLLTVQYAMERAERALRGPGVQRDPFELLDAHDLGQRLGGVSDQTVRQREQQGRLFSMLKAGRLRGREYPAFQAWEGIAGAPLASVLQALGPPDGAAAYTFFATRSEDSAMLTPVEILHGYAGEGAGTLSKDAEAILGMPHERRLAGVEALARAFACDSAA